MVMPRKFRVEMVAKSSAYVPRTSRTGLLLGIALQRHCAQNMPGNDRRTNCAAVDATYVFGSIITTQNIALVCTIHCQNSSTLHSVRSASDFMFGRDGLCRNLCWLAWSSVERGRTNYSNLLSGVRRWLWNELQLMMKASAVKGDRNSMRQLALC